MSSTTGYQPFFLDNYSPAHSQEMNDSIINHLFLPCDVPSSAEADYLIKSNHENEHKILEQLKEFLESVNIKDTLPIFSTLHSCVRNWLGIQNIQNCSVSNLQWIIQRLKPGDFLPLYFHAQNAAILIEIDENPLKQSLISSWQVCLPTEIITSSLEPHVSLFPSPMYRLSDRSQLTSQIHCELLTDFMNNTIEYSKSYKAFRAFDEIRDVPVAHYVCQWWITQFQGIRIENHANSSTQFRKKHRDQIRWKDSMAPFRRSGLWMTIKVVFHTILTKRLGKIGTIVYKLLMTAFLTYVVHTRQTSRLSPLSTDLLIHCLRKIVRRLNKIERLLSVIDANDMNQWIKSIRDQIKSKLDLITPKADWQELIKRNEAENQIISMTQVNPNHSSVYQHSCTELKVYLKGKHSGISSNRFSSNYSLDPSTLASVQEENQLPSVAFLISQAKYSIDIALTRVEIWTKSHLDQWIDRPLQSDSNAKRFEKLLSFFEDYQLAALDHYYAGNELTDSIGYSRFILTSLTIIRSMHRKLCTNQGFERLKLHAIQIPHLLNLFEFLVLPTRDDMIRARDLFDFFNDFSRKPHPDILADIESTDAFGIYFATHSASMNKTLEEIQTQVRKEQQNKIEEVRKAKIRYELLITTAYNLNCECDPYLDFIKCDRCNIIQQAQAIKVHIYESPIPSKQESALAVIFELQMPTEFRCYRDILWMFVNRPNPQPKTSMIEWLNVSPHNTKLRGFYKGPSEYKVRLVSANKSISQSHYSAPRQIASTPSEEFLYDNSLQVQISPAVPTTLPDECRTLTPQLTGSNYKHLQFSVDTTQFVQNQVIAELSNCPVRLKPTQYVDFGSFRSGHCLQWWNLLSTLELDSLSMDEESVAILITHSLLQYGPVIADRKALVCSWCPESHHSLLEDHFVDELISRLDRLLTNCGINWQNELVLVIITVIVMRIFTLCNSKRTDQVTALALKCRQTGEKWIQLISESISNASSSGLDQMDGLRDKIVIIGVACLLTFSVHKDHINCLLSSNQHVISLLKAATTVHDNIILSKKQKNASVFVRNLMRYSERILVSIHPTVSEFLKKTSYESLNEFAVIYWAAIGNNAMNGKWKKRNNDVYDGWYDGQYQSTLISIDCLKGTFLVNGMTIGFLPEKITSNKLFRRVFGDHVFEVQAAETQDTYITKHAYHGDGKVHYEFSYNDLDQRVTVQERYIQTDARFELILSDCLQTELPDILISKYSHWKNKSNQQIEFRPVRFHDSNFLSDKQYLLAVDTGFITTSNAGNTQILIKRASSFFQNLFTRYFIRLDDEPYVYMLRDNASHIVDKKTTQDDAIIHIYLSRLGIAFKYDARKKIITSREYPDMYVDQEQWFGTLTGLKSGLLLSPTVVVDQQQRHNLCRKLIVPFGEIVATRTSDKDHHTVTIDRTSKTFLHQYFVFILNDRLCILQSTDSPTGWLYLALLHAMTSHALPDQYTGMTGMERAFQLLNSAGCWSDQPYDSLSLDILVQIACLSPKASYYPDHLICMEKIEWNSHGLPCSMQHFGYYLIVKKLFQSSEQWNFMHPVSASQDIRKLFESKKYNETLLAKLYWDYRDSYNPTARLSTEMEREIQAASLTKPYRPVWENCSRSTNYGALRLVDNLYLNGDVELKDSGECKCFPLSRWLMSEYQLENIWIGLFKFIEQLKKLPAHNQPDEFERFELLLDFLHYISSKCPTQPFYLQLLKSILRTPTTTILRSVAYPSFVQYENIQEISVQPNRLKFPKKITSTKRPVAINEVKNCFDTNSTYRNNSFPHRGVNINEINMLLKSWRANATLRSFLGNIQNHIDSITIISLNTKINVNPSRFAVESFQNHTQIHLNSANKIIDRTLLQIAQRKYLRPHSGYFIKPTASTQIPSQQKDFPVEIFPSTDSQNNPLSNITNHFKEQLIESWRKFQSVKDYRNEYPPLEEINQYLDTFRRESSQLWNELLESITLTNELLFKTGLMLRITPSTLISVFQQLWLIEEEQKQQLNDRSDRNLVPLPLTTEQRTLLGGIMVNWVLEQQIERAIHFANNEKKEDFEKEISNVPHANWTPSKHVPWLIMELEMNITIREIQVEVAHHMMQPNMTENNPKIRNIVMQMNMGEGKTSVILPMLALSLCSSSSSLVRIIVLKSLFPTNYQSLQYKLGGLLNRRVLPFACRRDMNFNNVQVNEIFHRLQQGLINRDIVLTSPEDVLSFDLLTIDKCRRNEFDTSRSMLSVQRWLKTFARDVFDESDEILHVKYQLIYSIGGQQQIDGGMERWKTIQSVLNLTKQHAANIAQEYTEDVFYKEAERPSNFSEFRLLSHRPFPELCKRIVNDWIREKSYHQEDEQLILSFILDTNSSVDRLINQFPHSTIQLFLMLRGLLSSEVLLVGLKRRYRVKFGINRNPKFNRLMAVPFRAKDVAAENTEFGHPDVAIILTQLSYYYSGLNDSQMLQCFDRLNQIEDDPDVIYTDWILQEGENNVDPSIQHWKAVNIKDYQQRRDYLFPTLCHNMLVVNYYLNHFVFPREAKQFPDKLVSSAWDLSSSARTKIITGFSGTNDTQLLLPVHIQQYDLPELRKTDAIVLNNLLQPENENYQFLPVSASSNDILKQVVNYKQVIQVILDVGALFVDGTNRQIAVKWLNLSDKSKIDYSVYFESDEIFACDRLYRRHAFLTSPASERLERCVFYLDEIHTRGTDFKFPNDFRAAVTLGSGLSKDRLVQACMRMRKLGKHHWLSFWSSNEVHQQIQILKRSSILRSKKEIVNDQITLIDILRWVYENTQQATWDGLHHWAAQSLSFQRKVRAFRDIHWNNQEEVFTNTIMEKLAKECLEAEVLDLKLMYGAPKTWQTVSEIYNARYKHLSICSSTEIHEAVSRRLCDYGGSKTLLVQLLDEEQQRELEQELEEERQQKRPPPVHPCEPILHKELGLLCDATSPNINLSKLSSVFCPLPYAFRGTTFYQECQPHCWQPNLWITTEFKRVIQTRGESLDSFLRPARWVVIYRNQHIIFVSPHEANWLMSMLYYLYYKQRPKELSTTTLRLLLPRIKRDQLILVNNSALTIPPFIIPNRGAIPYLIPVQSLVELFVFNGTLYFENDEEQTAYCQCLGVCPKPRNTIEEVAFNNRWIAVDGFVEKREHRLLLQIVQCRFNSNPLLFVRKLVETRNNAHPPLKSHVGGILLNALKHTF
jgi:hypothetical protein